MGIIKKDFANIMRDDMDLYAHEVNERRAIPSAIDGLKPSQRRIIFTMMKDTKDYRGCADIVGNCLGRFAPHGDASCYEALVRLSQPLIMNYPLIDFQGNNGSLTDKAAAYRYTKAKLSKYGQALLQDIETKGVIEWQDNYSETEKEPSFLLGAIGPLNLLQNPSLGIGVGIASSWIGHNIEDLKTVLKYRMEHPNCSFEDLPPIYPSFTNGGGVIINKRDIPRIYTTGKGTVVLRAKFFIKDHIIHITEMPYRVSPTAVKKYLIDNPISGISEVYEGQGGYPLKIYLENNVDEEEVLKRIFKKTSLQSSLNVNMVATDLNGKPRLFTLLEILDIAIALQHRRITAVAESRKAECEHKLHINEGLEKALDEIAEVIAIIRNSENTKLAESNLIQHLGIDNEQAKAILDIRLGKLSHMEIENVRQLIGNLKAQIEYEDKVINDKELRETLYWTDMTAYTDNTPRTSCLDEMTIGVDGDKIKSDGYAIFDRDFFEYHPSDDQFEDGIIPWKYEAATDWYIITSHLRGFTRKGTDLPMGRTDWSDILPLEEGEEVLYLENPSAIEKYEYLLVDCKDGKRYKMHNSFVSCGCSQRGKRLTKGKYEAKLVKPATLATEDISIR